MGIYTYVYMMGYTHMQTNTHTQGVLMIGALGCKSPGCGFEPGSHTGMWPLCDTLSYILHA